MPEINNRLELDRDQPFEEITKEWYIQLLECIPPVEWSEPYRNGGWFFMGEPHDHDWMTGEAYHYLCFKYKNRYFAGCRSIESSISDVEREINEFCRTF